MSKLSVLLLTYRHRLDAGGTLVETVNIFLHWGWGASLRYVGLNSSPTHGQRRASPLPQGLSAPSRAGTAPLAASAGRLGAARLLCSHYRDSGRGAPASVLRPQRPGGQGVDATYNASHGVRSQNGYEAWPWDVQAAQFKASSTAPQAGNTVRKMAWACWATARCSAWVPLWLRKAM